MPQYKKVNWVDCKKDAVKVTQEVLDAAEKGEDASSLWSIFMNGLKSIITSRVPVKIVKDRKGLPWINASLKRLMRRRDKARKKWLKSKSKRHSCHDKDLHERYKELKRQTQSAMRRAYWTYLEDIITESDPKQTNLPNQVCSPKLESASGDLCVA